MICVGGARKQARYLKSGAHVRTARPGGESARGEAETETAQET